MNKFHESDLRAEAKANAEHITPIPLRKWIAERVGKVNTVFDCSIGSGQLLQFVDCQLIAGTEINQKSIDNLLKNFDNVDVINDNYFNTFVKGYDVAISNYPFSLNFKDLVEKVPVELTGFYPKGKITGKADFPFIIRSFTNARDKGYYLCFPGIAYRGQEQKFRDWLVENNYLKAVGTLRNCEFTSTTIDILYLELDKHKTDNKVELFNYDFKNNNNNISKTVDIDKLLNEPWITPQVEVEEEKIDIVALEKEIEITKVKRRKTEDELDEFIKNTFKH